MISELIFLVSLILLAYAWAGYPLILRFLTRPGVPEKTAPPAPLPIAILLSAYNEEKHIEARLENLLALLRQGFPLCQGYGGQVAGQAGIYVGIDGAEDGTAAIAAEFAKRHEQVHVHNFKQRRGKVAVLKDLVGAVTASNLSQAPGLAPILVFTDANTVFRPDALQQLLVPFGDSVVGGVCGRLVFVDGKGRSAAEPEENLYWKWETRLKTEESRLDSCLGANGAIFAIRRELFWSDIPDNTIVDDFVIGMKVREAGFRFVYQPDAVAEEAVPETRDEWNRRVRIGAGDYQALWLCRRCLLPRYGRFAWMFGSHKVLRWFTPHLMVLCILSALCLVLGAKETAWLSAARVVGLGAAAMLLCATVGRILRGRSGNSPQKNAKNTEKDREKRGRSLPLSGLFRQCDHFLTMQAALLVGFVRFCRGGLKGHWNRTPR